MAENDYNQNSELDFGADVGDFSWRTMDRQAVNAESQGFCQAVNKVAQLVNDLCESNSYESTATEYNNLCNSYLGRNSWVQEYYYANQSAFASSMKSASRPSGFFEMSPEEQIAFDYGLKCQRDAAECVKPLDQIMLLMHTVPLRATFQLVRATINLDDAGFDEALFKQIDDDVREVSAIVNKSWDSLERITNAASEYFYSQNRGKMSPSDLKSGYLKARLRDYQTTFKTYYIKASKDFTCNDYCVYSFDLNYYVSMMIIDEYMEAVAGILKENIDAKLENCIAESKKLTAVINSRREKCTEDAFNATLTAVEVLNYAIHDFCELGLNMCKNYKGLISAAPYCFMKKLPSSDSLNGKYGLKPMSGNPLSDGTKYADLISSAAFALTQHCHEFVHTHGRKDLT